MSRPQIIEVLRNNRTVSLIAPLASTVQMKHGEIERMLTIIDKNNRRLSETSILTGVASALLVGHIWKPAARLGLLAGAVSVLVIVLAPTQRGRRGVGRHNC